MATAATRSRARSSGVHSEIHFQPRPQSHRDPVFLSGAHGGVCRDVPVAADAHSHGLADGGAAARRRDQAGDVSQPADHARHDHGVLRADHGAAGRVRQLLPADSDRRAGHGVPRPEHAVVLDDIRRLRCDPGGVLRDRRRAAHGWTDIRRSARCNRRAGRRTGRRSVDHQHRDLLSRVADGRAELHHYDARSAGQGHDADAHAADRVVVVHHGDSRIARVRRAALGGHSAAAGPQSRAPAFTSRWSW